MHIKAEAIPIHEYVPDIPKPLEEIVMKVMSKEPSTRYRTADQLGRVLLKFGTQRDDALALSLTPEAANTFRGPAAQPTAPQAPEADLDIDWVSVVLGLLALIAVGGLIPFWTWVYFRYNPL